MPLASRSMLFTACRSVFARNEMLSGGGGGTMKGYATENDNG